VVGRRPDPGLHLIGGDASGVRGYPQQHGQHPPRLVGGGRGIGHHVGAGW